MAIINKSVNHLQKSKENLSLKKQSFSKQQRQ